MLLYPRVAPGKGVDVGLGGGGPLSGQSVHHAMHACLPGCSRATLRTVSAPSRPTLLTCTQCYSLLLLSSSMAPLTAAVLQARPHAPCSPALAVSV